jgi:hypothetical protein
MARLEDLLSKAHVTFCVDTNILVEFRALGELPWHELAPSASHVRIIVPTKVGKEMDAHKQSAGRLRKRAADFASLVARLERNDYSPLVLRERDPQVTVEFGALFKASDLDGDQFELDDPDNRIVAEAYRTAQEIPELVFISDDGLPIRLAHHAQLPVVRPPASWRRPEGTDEKDREIADLKRQLGPQPKLVLGFPDGVGDDRRHVLGMPPVTICPHCINRIATAILTKNSKVRRRVLEDRL